MAGYPNPDSVTICEINGKLVTVDQLSDDRANHTYGEIIGKVFRPLLFPAYNVLLGIEKLGRPFRSSGINYRRVSWHKHKNILAFISGLSQVTICDFEDFSQMQVPCILTSEKQRHVSIIEWRPNAGRVLCVACLDGFCIWAANPTINTETSASTSGTQWSLAIFIPDPDRDPFNSKYIDIATSAMSWCPNGRYLASAPIRQRSFKIMDVSQGCWTTFDASAEISYLKWSPTGQYFFAAVCDGTFLLYETNTWQVKKWSSPGSFATGASWSPDGRVLLVSFSGSSTIGSIHFSAEPPSLDACLEQFDALEMVSSTKSQVIDKIEWDGSGERLAVSFEEGDDNYRGLLAIYDTSNARINPASLIGFIRGPGKYPKPVSFAFDHKFKQGRLLSVLWSSGFCCTYPLIFSSNR